MSRRAIVARWDATEEQRKHRIQSAVCRTYEEFIAGAVHPARSWPIQAYPARIDPALLILWHLAEATIAHQLVTNAIRIAEKEGARHEQL